MLKYYVKKLTQSIKLLIKMSSNKMKQNETKLNTCLPFTIVIITNGLGGLKEWASFIMVFVYNCDPRLIAFPSSIALQIFR